ncbi:IS3 family transposase, partial [Exiguobacterium sp. SH5S4]
KIIFNIHQIDQLESNPNVSSVSERSIQYTGEFKVKAVLENMDGKGPRQIFTEAGFDLTVIGNRKAKSALERWRRTYRKDGEDGLLNDKRGKALGGGRPKTDESMERRLAKAEARIKYLTAENGTLKKAREVRRAGETYELTPAAKYQAINTVIRIAQLKNLVRPLCEIAGVSRSGYYAWLNRAEAESLREERDYLDATLLKQIHDSHKGKVGYRGLYMEVLATLGVRINHKRILRLMRKYNIVTKIRRMNPYRKLSQATHEHRVVPNLLNRQFRQSEPGKVFVTDITYLPIASGENVYLSCVKDVATREIVAHKLSASLHMDLVFQTMEKLEDHLQGNLHPEAMIHSDQGFHYTHPDYQQLVRSLGLVQSMSRRGNCLDNAPIESFFGHLKDYVTNRSCGSIEQVREMVGDYINYYNCERGQWNLKKMTPEQYRGHLIAA